MSTHKPLPIKGYTGQPTEKVDLVNENKVLEEHVLRQLDYISYETDNDNRWAAIARTHFEQGFMALNRAVFQPERLKGEIPAHTARPQRKD